MKIEILILVGCVTLVGCASNQKFDCPQVGGVRCQSMSEIEKLIDSGELEQNKTSKKKIININKNNFYLPITYPYNPSRIQEETIEVWVAAYESVDGIYHHPTLLNAILNPAKWDK